MPTEGTTIKTINLAELRQQIDEALTYLDVKMATELQGELEDLLVSSQLSAQAREEFVVALAKVKFLRFLSLGEREALDLVQENLLLAFNVPLFNFADKIGKRVLFLGAIELQVDFMDKLSKAISNCQQTLGRGDLEIEDKSYKPTVANWLKSYFNQPAKSALRTNMDEWSFVEQGPPAKLLDRPVRNTLLDILRIYDSLRNRVYSYNIMPESDDDKEIFPNYDLYLDLPGLTINEQDPEWKDKFGEILDPTIPNDDLALLAGQSTDESSVSVAGGYMNSQTAQIPPEVLAKPEVPVEPERTPPIVPTPNNQPAARKVEMNEIMGEQGIRDKGIGISGDRGQGGQVGSGKGEGESGDRGQQANVELGIKNQELRVGAPSLPNLPHQGEGISGRGQESAAPSKAEEFVQKEIDRKLHSLEEKTKGKGS